MSMFAHMAQSAATKSMKLNQIAVITILAGAMTTPASAILTHRYSFDTDVSDSVGTAHGTLQSGATVSGGQLQVNGTGAFANLPGGTIAINTYSAITLEMWSTQPAINQGFSMTASFGGTWGNGFGQNYLNIATTRGDNVSRGAIAITPDQNEPWLDEVGSNGAELNDAAQHYYALVVTSTQIGFYVDGALQGTMQNLGSASIAGLSNDFAYLGKGVYSVDGTVNGSINEFRIWNEALSGGQIGQNFLLGPSVVPEPSTIALAGLGLAALILRKRRA